MILLLTSSNRGAECAGILEDALREKVELAGDFRTAVQLLRQSDHSAVVLDELMAQNEPEQLDNVLNAAALAAPVYINMAICGPERMVREVRLALKRYQQTRLIAMRSAEALLRSEIRDAVTGILLTTELALRVPELPEQASEKLQSVCHLASQIRSRLETVQ